MEAERSRQWHLERRFLESSKVYVFLRFKEPMTFSLHKREYSLYVVMKALRQVIQRERLYDGSNTTCIMANPELEWALGMKFLHVTEMRDVVLKQMTPTQFPFPANNATPNSPSTFDIHGMYIVTQKFLKVLNKPPIC